MSDAKRYGGRYSPGGPRGEARTERPAAGPASRFSGRSPRWFSWRVLGLYLAPTPLLWSAGWQFLTADLPELLWTLGPYAVLMFAAWMTGQGQRAAAAFDARAIAKPPAFPRKLFAAVLTGAGVAAAAAFGAGYGIMLGAVLGTIAAAAHIAAFGLDPMRAKGVDGVADAELARVAEKLDEAEAVVAETVKVADGLRDRRLTDRIDRLAYAARDILREIQSDPRDLRRARRFLSVHLVGLRDATVKYAAGRARGAEDLRESYEGLLTDLETSFANQRARLMVEDQTELEVEIDVLRDRLKQEGAL
ncbi:MAG: 5-bromo-4-chloroindolyl phosphate hydrolysis family protein [Pseudomonadota bacterium]